MGGLSGAVLAFTPPDHQSVILISLIITKIGVSSALSLCFLVTSEYFPIEYCSTVFGACNVIARVTSIMAPMIAEVPAPYPMTIYVLYCFLTFFAVFILKKEDEKGKEINVVDEDLIEMNISNATK
jgi:glucan phosphoethanolaminetransferase (alkaline phosphatase superfamily)